jgi:hypothetical protein
MSLNSLQDDMSRRAASMAAMAKRARNPQEIQAIQKSLINGVQSGAIAPYVGIPLIQELTQRLPEAQAAMAQSMAGAGMPQPPQGGAPIAQQVMAQAAQDSQGVESLASNLPESYAGGGIIAFEEGGPVERFQVGNLVRDPSETFEQYRQRVLQQDAQNKEAQQAQENQAREAERQRRLAERGPIFPASPFVNRAPITPTTTPAAVNKDLGPVPGTTEKDVLGGRPTGGITALPGAGRRPVAPVAPAAPVNVAPLGQGPLAMPAPPTGKSAEDFARNQFTGLGERSDARLATLTAAQDANKMEGKAFDGLKKTLEEEAAQAGIEKSDAKNMAIFKAGLAMMSGTSRNALENIGRGAMVGAEDYQKAAADLKKADKERQKQFAAIEEARRAEDRDDIKTRNARLETAYKAGQRMDELGSAAISAGFGVDKTQGMDIWKTEFGGAKTIEAANISAAASKYSADTSAASARYSADRSADSRVQAAELRASLAGLGGGKGALTQDQLIKNRQALADSPQIAAYKDQLVKQYGKNVVNQPGYQEALNKQIDQLLMQMSAQPGASMGLNITPAQQSLISKYLNPR